MNDNLNNAIVPGCLVSYAVPGKEKPSIGVVKSLNGSASLYVVFHCGGNWGQYEKYTAALCFRERITVGWDRNEIIYHFGPYMVDYACLRYVPSRGLCGISHQVFTVGLFYGMTESGVAGRFCFSSLLAARTALQEWEGGTTDPGNAWLVDKGREERRNSNRRKKISPESELNSKQP